MWRYPGPSCPNRSFSAELIDAEVDTQVRKILALGVNRHSGSSLIPLRDGVVSPWVSFAQAYSQLVVSISAFLCLLCPCGRVLDV
jgi:hypothetical protein